MMATFNGMEDRSVYMTEEEKQAHERAFKKVEHRPGCHVICELPLGTTVKALNGRLVACHPDHAPIFIGQGNREKEDTG